jgi:hypothetical protein
MGRPKGSKNKKMPKDSFKNMTVEASQMIPMPEERNLADEHYGHVWTIQQEKLFIAIASGMKGGQATRVSGVSNYSLWSWQKKPWWRERIQDHLNDYRKVIETKYVSLGDDLMDGLEHVAQSRDDKTASARVNAVRDYLTAGPNPVINRVPKTVNNTLIQTKNLDISKYKDMSEDDMIRIALEKNDS